MDKGGWQPVIPPAIEADAHSKALMQGAWDNLSGAYRQLRAAGIRKEDARFLLPNAAETRMVVSVCRFTLGHTSAGSGQWTRPPSGR